MSDALAALGIRKSLVISLERSIARREPLMKMAAAQGVSLELLYASDGRDDMQFRSVLLPSTVLVLTCP